ncbi:MAG: CPBP family intramembrane glutamic endopeptidase [Acidimicrobiia bacterium]
MIFFLLAFVITWVVWVPRAIDSDGFFGDLGAFWTYGPALAAVATAAITAGRNGLRELWSRLTTWRVGWIWYVVAILAPLAIASVVGLVNMAFGGTFAAAMSDVLDDGIGAVALTFLALVLTDGLGEETGWRGYALPRLLDVTGAVWASIVLGLIWAAWHLPLFWTEGASLFETSILVLFVRLPATSIMFTWLFQRTKGSLLLAIIFHAALNLFGSAPIGDSLQVPWIGVAVQWVVAILLIPQVRRQHARSKIVAAARPTETPV